MKKYHQNQNYGFISFVKVTNIKIWFLIQDIILYKKFSIPPKYHLLIEVSFQYNTICLNNIAIIPAKKQKYGYFENKNGELIQAIDPSINKYFSSTRHNSIGHDHYSPLLKEKNPIVRWNRMSPRRLNMGKDNYTNKMNNNSYNNLDSSKISKLDTDISSSIKSGKERIKSTNQSQIMQNNISNNQSQPKFDKQK